MSRKDVSIISVDFCYQFICGGNNPGWGVGGGGCDDLTENEKTEIKNLCLPLKALLPSKATLAEVNTTRTEGRKTDVERKNLLHNNTRKSLLPSKQSISF